MKLVSKQPELQEKVNHFINLYLSNEITIIIFSKLEGSKAARRAEFITSTIFILITISIKFSRLSSA